jgi:uncharacterized membrane protein
MGEHLHSPFGTDRFGRAAERFARFFGTPRFILGQSALVLVWIALNAMAFSLRWDPYPFILLNLAFSTQAAYAAPLILLAQTRQADRDKVRSEDAARAADAQRRHVEQQTSGLRDLLAGQHRAHAADRGADRRDPRCDVRARGCFHRRRARREGTSMIVARAW